MRRQRLEEPVQNDGNGVGSVFLTLARPGLLSPCDLFAFLSGLEQFSLHLFYEPKFVFVLFQAQLESPDGLRRRIIAQPSMCAQPPPADVSHIAARQTASRAVPNPHVPSASASTI